MKKTVFGKLELLVGKVVIGSTDGMEECAYLTDGLLIEDIMLNIRTCSGEVIHLEVFDWESEEVETIIH